MRISQRRITRHVVGQAAGGNYKLLPMQLPCSKKTRTKLKRIIERLSKPTRHLPGSFAKFLLHQRRVRFGVATNVAGDAVYQVKMTGIKNRREECEVVRVGVACEVEDLEDDE